MRVYKTVSLFAALSLFVSVALFGCGAEQQTASPPESSPIEEIAISLPPSEEVTPPPQEETPVEVAEEVSGEPNYLLAARAENSDVVGWINLPDTLIDYPIVQTTDNTFYIDHDLEKKDSKSGAIFLDYRNADPDQQQHMILYGHNMKNGTMFHDLQNFKQQDFFDNHRRFSIWLYGEEREYEVISEFIVSTDIRFIQTEFASGEAFIRFMDQLLALSKFETGYSPSPQDEILTLSTCTYEYREMRNVVQAVRRK